MKKTIILLLLAIMTVGCFPDSPTQKSPGATSKDHKNGAGETSKNRDQKIDVPETGKKK